MNRNSQPAHTFIPADYPRDAAERLRQLRALAWLLDSAIPLPGGMRIGIDALLGLIPGLGDVIGALLSSHIINEARRLGAPRATLLRMMTNVLIETAVGSIPLAGDLFDAAFKANLRNIALLERHHLDPTRSRSTDLPFVIGFYLLLLLLVAAVVAVPVLIIVGLLRLF
jgi:hypothetical protein